MGDAATGIIVFVLLCVVLALIRWVIRKGVNAGAHAAFRGISRYAGRNRESGPQNLSDRYK